MQFNLRKGFDNMKKRYLCLLLAAAMLLSFAVPVYALPAAEMYMLGDVDNSGEILANDALLTLQGVVGKITLDEKQSDAADVDEKSGLSATDALLILQKVVGKISAFPRSERYADFTISEEALRDKIAGAWVGQMAGVAWSAPTEFQYNGVIMPESALPQWKTTTINDAFYQDDLYVEIPFMQAMIEKGFDCSIDDLGEAFKNTTFSLAHANYLGRYNLSKGIKASEAGSYLYNYHADDIDWQIESDFLGSVYPGMINEAAERAFEIGHLMNYGDGVYGGVFVSAMHAAGFTAKNLDEVIAAGLDAIPDGTKFKNLMNDVMACYKEGKTWEEAWQLLEDKWNGTDKCPDAPGKMNIDAKINAGYVLIGLLYGEGDFEKSMAISMRCGQDSDCNPSTVAGVLGKLYGLSGIPDKYKSGADYNGQKFAHTDYTLDDTINATVALAEKSLEKKQAVLNDGVYSFSANTIVNPVKYEQWPDDEVTVYINAQAFSDMSVSLDVKYVSPKNPSSIKLDMGDGTVYNEIVTKHTYAQGGTYLIRCTVSSGDIVGEASLNIFVEENKLKTTAITSHTDPQGAGNPDISVINDGFIPDPKDCDSYNQYDTFGATGPSNVTWFGLEFERAVGLKAVDFYQGAVFDNGGWFAAAPKIEVLFDGMWVEVKSAISPEYPTENALAAHGDWFDCYKFTLEDTVVCDGVRIAGAPGGTNKFASCSEIKVDYIETEDMEDVKSAVEVATPVVSQTSPAGGGSKDINVIRDGIISGDGSAQYDTYSASEPLPAEFFGYEFDGMYTVTSLTYTDGIHYANGGWFRNGTLKVQVLVDGAWKDTASKISPAYPNSDSYDDFSENFVTYRITLDRPAVCYGIRIIGEGGGSSRFVSCAELDVAAFKVKDTRTLEQKSEVVYNIKDPTGGGNKDINVIRDGVVPDSSVYDGSLQYDTYTTYEKTEEEYFGYVFAAKQTVSALIYTDGIHFGNGGWYADGSVRIQILVDDEWKDVKTSVSPEYPNANSPEAFSQNFKTYTFTLDQATVCDGVRIIGTPGGNSKFVSCAELSVKLSGE